MGVGDNKGTWVPEKERTTAWCIFNELFMCRVANIQTMSAEYIAHFGTPDSGDPVVDRETANESVIKMLTINQMAEFFKQGTLVYVVNLKDTKVIYERIVDHLNAWKQRMSDTLNNSNAPIDDLLLLDRLAGSVYKHAAPQFTTAMAESLIARRAGSVMRVNRDSVLKRPVDATTINPIPEKPERVSMAESFAKHRPNPGSINGWRN